MKRLLRPSVIVPAVLSFSLIGGLIAFANGGKVFSAVLSFSPIWLLPFAGVALAYEATRLLQWHLLLHHLGIRARLPTEILSYLSGEVAKYAPAGTFLQNYVLLEVRGTDVGLSSAATTAAILLEPLAALLIVLILGIPQWGWVRPTIGSALPVAAVAGWAIDRWHPAFGVPLRLRRWRLWKHLCQELSAFREGLGRILDLRLLPIQIVIAMVYVALGGVGLFLVLGALHARHLSLSVAVASYALGVAFALLIPLMTDLGSLEWSTFAALLAGGLTAYAASAGVIIDRALMILFPALMAVVVGAVFRDLVRRAIRSDRPPAPKGERAPSARVESE